MDIERVGVVGCGLMGSGIAEVCARAGLDVVIREATPEAAEAGLARITGSLERATRGGKLSEADRDTTLARMRITTDYRELADRQLVVEAVVESEELKAEVFGLLDKVIEADDAVLASNTSSIPISSLAAVTGRPDKVIGMHFFNPVPVLKLVEIIRARDTSDETAAAITRLAEELGKTPAVANDFPGFVSNRILMPFINEAVWALHDGVAEAEAIDTIAKLGFAHPLGPLALADLIGLDTCVAIMGVLQQGLGDDRYAPCPLLRDLVTAGKLGRKSGAGFYEYA
jgi:3-hydroxybutyryl-CoA dehydrogenase